MKQLEQGEIVLFWLKTQIYTDMIEICELKLACDVKAQVTLCAAKQLTWNMEDKLDYLDFRQR